MKHAALCPLLARALRLPLTASFTSKGHQASCCYLMRLKGIEDLAAFSTKKVKSTAARRKRERSIFLRKVSVSKSREQSHPNELSSGERETVRRIGRWPESSVEAHLWS